MSMLKLKYLTINCRRLLRANAIDKKIASKTIAKISNEVNKKRLRRVKMQMF